MSVFTNPASSSKAEAAAYITALLELLGSRPPLAVLQATPALARELIADVADARLATAEAPGKWAVRHVLAHLADSEVVLGWRLRMILAQDRPPIQGYDQDAWADSLDYGAADPQLSLDTFAALRRWNLRLVRNASADVLQRVGLHAERGEESVEHLMKLYAAHDLLHLNQIKRILDAV